MAPLPSNNTAVLFVDYTGCGEGHTAQVRYGTGSSATDAMTLLDAVWTAMTPRLRLVTITGARVRDIGTNVTYPVTWTGASTYGSGAGFHFESAYYADFVGRSIDGRRCRLAFFCAIAPADVTNDDFRVTAAENSDVDDAITALNAGSDVPVTISGGAVNWQLYTNIGTNAYWRNRIR